MSRRLVLHALGGCHINGYPFGPEDSFLLQALGQSLHTCDLRILAPASLGRIDAYLADPANLLEGSIVVLQVGNHESTVSWREAPLASSGATLAPEPGGAELRVKAIGAGIARTLVPGAVQDAIKLRVFRRRERRGEILFHRDEFAGQIEHTLALLASRRPAHVIVLTPFAARSPDIDLCRERAGAVIAVVASRHGFELCDARAGLKAAVRAGERLFHDAMHLNHAGHRAVAGLLSTPLQRAIAALNREAELPRQAVMPDGVQPGLPQPPEAYQPR